MATPILRVSKISKHYGEVEALRSFDLEVDRGEFVTLLGPSGCGKTTTLRVIMGFIRADSGRITLSGTALFDAERGINLAPEVRNTSMVFQSYAVWPHMSVFENVAYPGRVKRLPKRELHERTDGALALVGLRELAGRHPQELSGGQQQRVALARALSMRANLLLLDEPLSNLDAKLRESMRFEIRRLQRETESTTIYVTHDQTEAMAMSDRIVVMNSGRIEQVGTPEEIYARPVNRFVASFIGTANFLDCTVVGDRGATLTVRLPGGREIAALSRGGAEANPGKGTVMVRPEDFEILPASEPDGRGEIESPTAGAAGGLPARILRRTFLGDSLDYLVEAADGRIRVKSGDRGAGLSEGDPVWLRLVRPAFLLDEVA